MRPEWRPPYDPLPPAPRQTRTADAVWCLHIAVSLVPGCAWRFSERSQIELADLAGDHGQLARPVRPGPIAADPLLAVGKVFRAGRFWIFVFLQCSGGKPVVAARAQHAAADSAGAADLMAYRCSAGRAGGRMEGKMG